MSSAPESPRLKLYLLHRWTGLLIAALTVPVIFSGTVATFHEEIDAWATRGEHHASLGEVPGFDLDAAYAAAVAGVPERQRHMVNIWQDPGHPLQFFFFERVPNQGDRGVAAAIDPATLDVLRRRAGGRLDATAPSPASALARFFVDLHVFLLLPLTPGLIVTVGHLRRPDHGGRVHADDVRPRHDGQDLPGHTVRRHPVPALLPA